MTPDTLIPILLVFGATASGVVALVLLWELVFDALRRRTLRRRLVEVFGESSGPAPEDGASGRASTSGREKAIPDALRKLAPSDLPLLRELPTLLERADSESSPAAFVLVSVGSGLAFAAVAFFATGGLLLPALVFPVGLLIPYVRLRVRIRRGLAKFEEQFPEALELLTRAIRAGHPLTSGMQMVGEEGPARVAREFRKSMEEHRFGLPFDDALLGMVDRVDLVDVRIFATAILIQRESGGNLAEILENLGDTIRDRFSIRRQLRTYTAQGRMSGYVLGALPIVVGSLIYLIEPSYVGTLFGSLLGQTLLVAAVVLQILGFFWIRKIINIEI